MYYTVAVRTAYAFIALPMTYQGKNGKQYVAIVAGPELKVFALP